MLSWSSSQEENDWLHFEGLWFYFPLAFPCRLVYDSVLLFFDLCYQLNPLSCFLTSLLARFLPSVLCDSVCMCLFCESGFRLIICRDNHFPSDHLDGILMAQGEGAVGAQRRRAVIAGWLRPGPLRRPLLRCQRPSRTWVILSFPPSTLPSFLPSAHDETFEFISIQLTVLKTGASGLIAYRLQTKDGQWQWLQTSSRLVYKNSKPDFIISTHRPLM